MFSLTEQQKRDRVLHMGLTKRLVPEWTDVPYFTGGSAATSTVPKIWEGDGAEVMADLIDTAHGRVVELVDASFVEQMLSGRRPASPRAMQRFSYLAVASQRLEPDTVRPSTSATHQRVTEQRRADEKAAVRAARRQSQDKVLSRLRWIKRTGPGKAIWDAVGRRIRS